MKIKILYMMHVDWGWIKQRPHFLAEKLNKEYDIHVFYSFSRNREVITSNPTNIKLFPIITLPLKKLTYIRRINNLLQKNFFSLILTILKPDIIWITHPSLHDFLPRKKLGKYKVVYDCMDDVLAFSNSQEIKNDLYNSEKRLLQDAELVFVSSVHLQNQIIKRGCKREKTVLVRNGYNGELIDPKEEIYNSTSVFRLGYVGTISNWIDFQIILNSLDELENIEYHFFGPVECQTPTNNRVIFHGPIKHSELYNEIKNCDCLIMPFKLNDVVLSVDPVKLYEYVNFNKNIIAIFYEEIERFKPFVHFYSNEQEYIDTISKLIENNNLKYNQDQRIKFLAENTWDNRTEIIIKNLKN